MRTLKIRTAMFLLFAAGLNFACERDVKLPGAIDQTLPTTTSPAPQNPGTPETPSNPETQPNPTVAIDATAIFSDDFDSKPDWSVPYTTYDQSCNKEAGCTNYPEGYYGYYISRSVISPLTGNGLHLDSTNHRGSSGKGLTFWDQTRGVVEWTSGMQIGVDFPAQEAVYVRYWIKMQPGYRYDKGTSTSMMRKLNHISHYLYNGKPFTFFTAGGFFPTTVNQLGFANANLANLCNTFFIRPDPSYNGVQANPMPNVFKGTANSTGIRNHFDLPNDDLPIGNYSGTGTEYNSPGMLADGGWHSLEFYLRNNSAPGVPNGEYKFWMDGVLQIYGAGLIYREAASNLPKAIWNFVHVGGNIYNPFRGSGISGEQFYAVDDLVISTHYSGPPATPVNVVASSVTPGVVHLEWEAGTNGASYLLSGYRIYYRAAQGGAKNSVRLGKNRAADISGLVSGQEYQFQVTAVNRASYDSNENESITPLPVSVIVK